MPQVVKTYGVTIAVAVAVVLVGAVATLAISSNRGSAVVTCEQVLKLRDADLKNVNFLDAAVRAGWAIRERPNSTDLRGPVTAAERATAKRLFEGQRAALRAVHCP